MSSGVCVCCGVEQGKCHIKKNLKCQQHPTADVVATEVDNFKADGQLLRLFKKC